MLINDQNTLQKFLPNQVVTVDGELTLFDKVQNQLALAEEWAKQYVTGEQLYEKISADKNSTAWCQLASLVANRALVQALPALDLILTPNGFGVVNNANVVPASRDRVDRLLASLLAARDRALDFLLDSLCTMPDWQDSTGYNWWTGCFVQRLSQVAEVVPDSKDLYEDYLKLRLRAVYIEAELEAKFFGPLMPRWRRALATRKNDYDVDLAESVQAEVIALLKGEQTHINMLRDIVQYVRTNPDKFPEWASSKLAKQWSPEKFNNQKKSKGFWF